MAWVSVLDLEILGGKITKICPLNSSSLPNVQRMHIIQYKFWLVRRFLQYDVFITNKNYIYGAIWTILITFYHAEAYIPRKQGVGVTIHKYLLRQIIILVSIIIRIISIYLEYDTIPFKAILTLANRLNLPKLFSYLEKNRILLFRG